MIPDGFLASRGRHQPFAEFLFRQGVVVDSGPASAEFGLPSDLLKKLMGPARQPHNDEVRAAEQVTEMVIRKRYHQTVWK